MRQAEDTMPYKSRTCIFMSGCAIYVDVYLQYNVQLIAKGANLAVLGSKNGWFGQLRRSVTHQSK